MRTPSPLLHVLYIDTYTQFGHVALNEVYINNLASVGLSVEVVMADKVIAQMNLDPRVLVRPIPLRLITAGGGRVSDRMRDIRILKYIKGTFALENYGCIFLSSFDEIVLSTVRLRGRLLLLAHGNVAGMDNPLKRLCMMNLSRYATFVVFHEFIKKRCEEIGINDVFVEAQGISKPYVMSKEERCKILSTIDARLTPESGYTLMFVPSGAKYNDTLLRTAIGNEEFLAFLKRERIKLAMKEIGVTSEMENVITISRSLNRQEYQALFTESACIILSYPESFTYRVSAILLECFSNEKICLLSDITAFRAFDMHFRYTPYFNGIFECMNRMKQILSLPAEISEHPFMSREELNPSFTEIKKIVCRT